MNLVPYKVLYEEWQEATLPDRTVIRFRSTVTGLAEDGPGNFQLRQQPQYQVYAPEEKQRAPKQMTRRLAPVEGVVSGVQTSSYEHQGGVLRLMTTINRVFQTAGYDGNNEPIFQVDLNVQLQHIPNVPAPAS